MVGRSARFLRGILLTMGCAAALLSGADLPAQSEDKAPVPPPPPNKAGPTAAPAKVDVQPVARDEEIRKRLQSVLEATGWFVDPKVQVDEGVVFLNGLTDTPELKAWATDLARNTQDVVAVANRIDVVERPLWDFDGAWGGLLDLWRDFIRSLPFLVFGLMILALSAGAGWLAAWGAAKLLKGRIRAKLLRSVFAQAIGAFVFLAGVYVVLRVSGLTQLALTIVGGTGLLGLAVGIAFRDITENFLASIFLTVQRPFETGDLVQVADVTGYVQQLNIRTTVLMTLDGNLVQVPNATVYKSTLRNFTVNPNRRESFVVAVGYEVSIDEAQETARQVLTEHPAVLKDPEPWVLVEALEPGSVTLRIYFWLNGHEYSWLKVRSAVIRLVKLAFQQRGFKVPPGPQEVVFPRGLPVQIEERREAQDEKPPPQPARTRAASAEPNGAEGDETPSNKAEAGLSSEAATLKEQAKQAKPLAQSENLLRDPAPHHAM